MDVFILRFTDMSYNSFPEVLYIYHLHFTFFSITCSASYNVSSVSLRVRVGWRRAAFAGCR